MSEIGHSLEEQRIRAGQAREILDSTLFVEARKRIEATLAAQRRAAPLTSTEIHTRLIVMEQLWGYLLDFFEQTALTGKMAELQLEEQKSRMAKVAQMFRR